MSTVQSISQQDEYDALYSTDAVLKRSVRPSPPSNLTAAEQEWLQEDEIQPSHSDLPSPFDTPPPVDRFDWRLRTTSRVSTPSPAPTNDDSTSKPRRKYVRRVTPPQVTVEQGERFYDAIQAYQNQCAVSLLALLP